MFPNASGVVIYGGTFNSSINHTSRGMNILLEWVATGAFHNSDELYDAPKCHPRTRVAVLKDIMKWVGESGSAWDDFIMWLFGPAGAGKSAIAKRIAEIAADMGMLIATFFFSRASPTRSNKDRLIATLAYQLALSIPDIRPCIENAIEQDPTIFRKNVQIQIDTLLIKPFQSISPTQIAPSKKLIIIDGLDECNDSQAQVAILKAISRCFTQCKLPIKFLVVSRPEPYLVTSFNCHEPLRFIHRRLALDDSYRPSDDIRLFFSDKFEHIKQTHLLRSTIPTPWPTQETLDRLVEKSSGQFIYASTVVKFVESICHRPSARLNIILGISPPGATNPFTELDALYNRILSSVDNLQLTLRVLSLYIMTPKFASLFRDFSMSPERFLSLEPGDIHLALINLPSVITYDESSGTVDILHASLVDFLSDRRRSTIFHIDIASISTYFVYRILQYMNDPDGIQSKDVPLFHGVGDLSPWVLKGQLRSDILSFDIEAFLKASIRYQYEEYPYMTPASTILIFDIWNRFLINSDLEYNDQKQALNRLNKSFESRLHIYQSDWRLQLLVTLAVADVNSYRVPYCKCVDILLEMDDHDLHLVDQHALDLRHGYLAPWLTMIPRLDGDAYASAALHCMRFLFNPPKYSSITEHPEMGLIYAEWKATCAMTLEMLCKLLLRANTSPELVQFISNHDIHPTVQNSLFADDLWEASVHILAFLSRASVCSNWRITSAIRGSRLIITQQRLFQFEENNASSDENEWNAVRHFIHRRLDRCCSNAH